jgi:hypothetical protein
VIGILRHHGFLRVGPIRKPSEAAEPGYREAGIVARHRSRVLPLGTMKAIIEGSGIAPTEWLK